MKYLKIKIIILTVLISLIVILQTTGVKAALQANPNTHIKKYDKTENWIRNFRKMETTGGAMGLSETLN